jgi:hypothetical protein
MAEFGTRGLVTLQKEKTRSVNICNQDRQSDQGNSEQKGAMMSFPETGTTFCNDDLFRFCAHGRAPYDNACYTARTAHWLCGSVSFTVRCNAWSSDA